MPEPAKSPTIGCYLADEDLLDLVKRERRACVRLTRPESMALVLGRSSKAELEIDFNELAYAPIVLLRRRGGGCTVLLDPGNLVVSIALPIRGFGAIDTWFHIISAWLIKELATAGIAGVTREGVSDLVLFERKIGGSCIFRGRDLLYYATTLLIEADLGAIGRYLTHPPREPGYRAGRPHEEFLGRLADLVPGTTTPALQQRLVPRLSAENLLAFARTTDTKHYQNKR